MIYYAIHQNTMIVLGDGRSTVDEPWQDRGGPTVAKYDQLHTAVLHSIVFNLIDICSISVTHFQFFSISQLFSISH